MTGIEPPDPHVLSHWLAQLLAALGFGLAFVRRSPRRPPGDTSGR